MTRVFVERPAVRVVTPERLEWHVGDAAPELASEALRLEPSLGPVISALRSALPAARTARAFESRGYCRPPGHERSFFLRLGSVARRGRGQRDAPSRACVVFKGTEVLAGDFEDRVGEELEARVEMDISLGAACVQSISVRSELRAVDKWPILEKKLPCAYALDEALLDARAAEALQLACLRRYGSLARVPLPLAVVRWPDRASERVRRALKPMLSPRAARIVDVALSQGLGAYAYYWPEVPVRVAHLPLPQGGSYSNRRRALDALYDVKPIIDGWLDTAVRIFATGFVPNDPTSVVTGDCLQIQNLVVDGGFADVDSVVPAEELRDERAVDGAIRRAVAELAGSIATLLSGDLYATDPRVRDRLPDVYALVWSGLRERLGADREQYGPIEPRIERYFLGGGTCLSRLERIFAHALE